MMHLFASLLVVSSLFGSAVSQATLLGRDLDGNASTFEAYFDTDLNVTWLADANYAQTSGYDPTGEMAWSQATLWAANLSFTDGVNVYDDWRLPATLEPDPTCNGPGTSSGYYCTGSELGHLFYVELGGQAAQDINAVHNANYDLFLNIQSTSYWSATEQLPNVFVPGTAPAYLFRHDGLQMALPKENYAFYAWAVSPGDVANVPEPATWLMVLSGLALLYSAGKRKRLGS
jgi:hypothetical protein